MADKDKKITKTASVANDKKEAIQTAMKNIEKMYGKGSIMRLGDQTNLNVEVIPTGSLALDLALGIGGVPKGRIIEIYGPESSGKTTLALHIVAQAQKAGGEVAFVDAEEIDKTDILSARMKAMQLAIDGLSQKPEFALIDGNRDKGRSGAITTPHRCLIKGDSLSASIAAASILAKVSRDRFMVEMAEQFPEYRFDKHKGYGTKLHYELLARYGPSPIHRRTFLKKERRP